MTEFDYGVKSRKALVPSARKKINGCKSRKCVLPSDYMTKGEIKKMNGKLVAINMNKPYSFKELTAFPLHLQKEYVENLRDRFAMSVRMFVRMANVSESKASVYFKKTLGLEMQRGLQATAKQRMAFDVFLRFGEEKQDANLVTESQNDEVEQKVDEVGAKASKPAEAQVGWIAAGTWTPPLVAKLAYQGTVRDICEALIAALGAGSVGRIEVAFRAEKTEG